MTAGPSGADSARLRVGIVGGGTITQVAHLPVLKKMRTVEIQGICDIDQQKARALADRFGVKDAFDDIEDLLRFETLDAVVICSPTHLHESHIQAALAAKVHVLVEKPLAMSAASVQRIIRTVEKQDRVVMVDPALGSSGECRGALTSTNQASWSASGRVASSSGALM